MFARLVGQSFIRNPRRKLLTAAALAVGMAVATATLTVALEVGDRMAREFRSLGANLLVTPQSDTLPLEIGGVDYRPVDEGAYLNEADLGKLKTIFWRHNILGFTPFLDVPAELTQPDRRAISIIGQAILVSNPPPPLPVTVIGTWYEHEVSVPDGTKFKTGLSSTHPFWKVQGRWFQDGAKECVIGANLARRNAALIPGGATVYLNAPGRSDKLGPLTVTGIASTGGAEDDAIFVPLSIAQAISKHPGQFRQLYVSALTKPADTLAERDPKSLTPTEYDQWFCSPYISSISYQIEHALPGTNVRAIRRVADSEGRILSHVSTLLWIVTIAAFVAAALAVAATSAAAVLERRVEIGVMKAIGATNTAVTTLFLTEHLTLALMGGAVGFVFGTVLARFLGASVFGTPTAPQFVLLPIVLGLAALVALVGGLIPIRRIAHFDPAPILRGE
ncbi:MAG TPA: ABC transporter permease [Candidatus Acidoferrum sp.]|nr:ABC transporter permease [Candidatus Acidoferrum sp.]